MSVRTWDRNAFGARKKGGVGVVLGGLGSFGWEERGGRPFAQLGERGKGKGIRGIGGKGGGRDFNQKEFSSLTFWEGDYYGRGE